MQNIQFMSISDLIPEECESVWQQFNEQDVWSCGDSDHTLITINRFQKWLNEVKDLIDSDELEKVNEILSPILKEFGLSWFVDLES